MRTVRDDSGTTFLLVKRSGEEWLVRDPTTGQERYRPAAELSVVEDASPLETVAAGVPEPVRAILTAVRTEQALGLLCEIERSGPLSVRAMLDRYEYCESDLHGQLAEFRAAGLIEERRVAGERGYGPTETASAGLEAISADRA